MKNEILHAIICSISIFLFSNLNLYSQDFRVNEISSRVFTVSNPDLGSQVAIRTPEGLVVFDSFWSEKTAGMFRQKISETARNTKFSYVINIVDRLDLIGGNSAYQDAIIVGHDNIKTKFGNDEKVKEEINDLVEMWREKAGYSRDRLNNMENGTEERSVEQSWLSKCNQMADELESSFSLELPEISFKDRMTIRFNDLNIDLIWFGEAGNYQGLTVAVIREEKLAIFGKALVYPDQHLAPFPMPFYGKLDVPRWISVLEELLEGENAVDRFLLSDDNRIYTRELMQGHLDYIRKLWNSVRKLDSQGKTLDEIQNLLSLDNQFSFVKEIPVYKACGDNWIRPQHEMHLKNFFLQGKENDSEQ